ncbi:MBL fold metallo-hydrolase [Mesobacillus foraminis]|uniref:MBL fold metallo-hydrolase n=1 Tax=Mesobacillus foraminis TaxID=279826 RepID=UPI001BE8EEA6|nr:MBL fold metallo-hydrolase [Mesobacillus foraminis]MBT2758355.1 MBL fold metallo-hydrolase [Mesobacillus foraminis]
MDKEAQYGGDYKFIPATSVASGMQLEIAPDIFSFTVQIVNLCFVGTPGQKEFVIVDAGMPGSAEDIITAAQERFGGDSKPKAIILTHGHFDHVGAVIELVQHWNIPVYAHEAELPYLTGKASYPEPDATVEGGLVAKMSPMFPNEPINLGSDVHSLPADGSVPHLPGFRWVHTPGHSPGHVSLFRDSDRALIAGDAFVTVKQESLYKVLTQQQEISGPPRYLTPDWKAAWDSVKKLEALKPFVAITGHGAPMAGELLAESLHRLVQEFDTIAIPDYGKYVDGESH